MKTVRLPEFKKFRQLKQLLLEIIRDIRERGQLYEGIWTNNHEDLYCHFRDFSEELLEIIDTIVSIETKLQLPLLIDNDVKFVL